MQLLCSRANCFSIHNHTSWRGRYEETAATSHSGSVLNLALPLQSGVWCLHNAYYCCLITTEQTWCTYLFIACVQPNSRTRFNVNSQVVLKACSAASMTTQMWEKESNAAILGADIAPKGLQVARTDPVVTVTLLSALPKMAKTSLPYTFAVTASFASTDSKSEAYATLYINYVSG